MTVRTRITDKGVIQEAVDGAEDVGNVPTLSVEVPVNSVGSDTVTWAPHHDPAEAAAKGWVTDWATAVATVQKSHAPETVINIVVPTTQQGVFEFIHANGSVSSWEVMIPGGQWDLNNTLIVGPLPDNADTDGWGGNTGRPIQDLLYVYTENDWNNPCKITGCRGLKNMYFEGEEEMWAEISDFSVIPASYDEPTYIYVSNTDMFRVGQRVLIGDYDQSDYFVGYYVVVDVNSDDGTIAIYNDDYDSSSDTLDPNSGYWRVWPDTSVFTFRRSPFGGGNAYQQKEFVLDHVELRQKYWNYDNKWGTIHFDFGVEGTLRMVNNSYTHAKSVGCYADQLNVVTRDACKLGWSSFHSYYGNHGYIQFHIGAGSRLVTYQPVDNWDGYYPYIMS